MNGRSETENLRAEALYIWIDLEAGANACLETSKKLKRAEGDLRDLSAFIRAYAPDTGDSYEEVLRIIGDVAERLKHEGHVRGMDATKQFITATADDPRKEDPGESAPGR